MYINKALLKNGYSNFSLEILIYCEPAELLKKENEFFNLLKPKYNILPTAGSPLGTIKSEETKQKISEAIKVASILIMEQIFLRRLNKELVRPERVKYLVQQLVYQ